MLTKKLKTTFTNPILKNFLIYSFSSLLLRGMSVITAPITMNILSPSQYGLLALANSFISILTLFLGLGLRQAFSLEFFHCTLEQQKAMLNDIIITYLTCTTIIFALLFTFHSTINNLVFAGHATRTLIFISLLICFVYFFVELFYQVLQYQTKAKQLALTQAGIAIITIALQLTLLIYFKLGVTSMLLAQLVGMCIAASIGLKAYLKKNGPAHINVPRSLRAMRNYLKLGLPFIPSVLFGWILSSGDRWVLAQLSSMHAVGIYSLADAFGQLFHLLVLYPMSCSYLPHMLRTFAQDKDNLLAIEQWNQKNMIYSMTGIAALITVGYVLCKPILYYLLPIAYHEAVDYIWFILMGYVFLMGTYFANCLIQYHKKSYFLGLSLLLPATLNIALNFVLIPQYQIYGCVFATLLSYASYFGITLWYNMYLRRIPIVFPTKKLA